MNGTDENKVDSLIAELRSFGDRPPPRFAWKRIADELESAVKEEREELREADTAKMLEGATIIDNRGQGNAAAMRRALVEIRDTIMNGGFDGRSPAHFVNLCDAALSAPPRQCDVGSADEQLRRWRKFCENFQYCVDCPLNKEDGLSADCLSADCFANWTQMPYGEGESK